MSTVKKSPGSRTSASVPTRSHVFAHTAATSTSKKAELV